MNVIRFVETQCMEEFNYSFRILQCKIKFNRRNQINFKIEKHQHFIIERPDLLYCMGLQMDYCTN